MAAVRLALPDLIKGRFIERPNRFLGRVRLGQDEVLAHVNDPGRLTELLFPGATVYVSVATGSGRKTAFDVKLVATPDGGLVSIDSGAPNRLAHIAFTERHWASFAGYDQIKPEFRHKNSRFDFLLSGTDLSDCYVEIKGCTLVEDGTALFPDAPTSRGARQVGQLTELAAQGKRAAVIFIIGRSDAVRFCPHNLRDPAFAEALHRAHDEGVEILAYSCQIRRTEIVLSQELPVRLDRCNIR